jgi:subtilisin family serine protease
MAFPGDRNLHLVNTPPGLSVSETVRRYQANPSVLYAEPDYVVQVDSVPTDPGWNQQWDMVKISAPTAWNTQTDSSSLVVAIIDTGINFKHPDLQANLWTNSDGSHGFTCMRGRCAKGGDDDYGHGTHVAGTIGAAANNGIGIAGLNWHAKLMSVKFLDASGAGSISDAVLAFDQVTALKQQGVNVRLTNNSWGSGGFSQALKDAMARAEAAGILHVCAAGNSGQLADASPMYPRGLRQPRDCFRPGERSKRRGCVVHQLWIGKRRHRGTWCLHLLDRTNWIVHALRQEWIQVAFRDVDGDPARHWCSCGSVRAKRATLCNRGTRCRSRSR